MTKARPTNAGSFVRERRPTCVFAMSLSRRHYSESFSVFGVRNWLECNWTTIRLQLVHLHLCRSLISRFGSPIKGPSSLKVLPAPVPLENSPASGSSGPGYPSDNAQPGASTTLLQRTPSKEQEEAKIAQLKTKGKRGRSRARSAWRGVSAAHLSQDKIENFQRPVYPKTAEEVAEIERIIAGNKKLQVLFGHLGEKSMREVVIEAIRKVEVRDGETIIRQVRFWGRLEGSIFCDLLWKRIGGRSLF